MELHPRKVYDRFSFEMAQQNIEIEEWEDLEHREQDAWAGLMSWLHAEHGLPETDKR